MRQTFQKKEKLCSRSLIRSVNESGRSFSSAPFRIRWQLAILNADTPVQILMSVPKMRLKRAVDRNRIKRLMRESYRKNKLLIYNPISECKKQIALILVYQSSTIIDQEKMDEKIVLTLQRFNAEFGNQKSVGPKVKD